MKREGEKPLVETGVTTIHLVQMPKRVFAIYAPQRDITAYELALILPWMHPARSVLTLDDWERHPECHRHFLMNARAVLEALQEPTEEMLRCAEGAGWHGNIEGISSDERDAGKALWRSMIQAALKEE